jgi:large subunit ribosomal protein L10
MSYTSKGTPKKIEAVADLTEKVGRAASIILAEYTGIKHKQLEEVRRKLKSVNAELVVVKNRLFKRSIGVSAKTIEPLLEKQTAILFAYDDEIAPLKELKKFFSALGFGRLKGGLLGKIFVSETDVDRLSKLPSREVLLGQLVGQLNAPIQKLHGALAWNINRFVWVINSIKNSKSS